MFVDAVDIRLLNLGCQLLISYFIIYLKILYYIWYCASIYEIHKRRKVMIKETKKPSLKQVALSEATNTKLDEISKQRNIDESFCWRKKDIVSKLIDDLYKKEVKS